MKRLVVLAMWSLFASSAVLSQRLPENVVPDSYDLKFEPDLASATFAGDETIHVHLQKATTAIVLNSAEIEFKEVWIGSADFKQAAAGPIAADVGATLVPGEADEKRALRASVFVTLAMYSRDPQSIERSRALVEQYMKDPNSVYPCLASSALYASALEGNAGLYERYLEHMKTAKTPEEYYNYFGALTQFPSVSWPSVRMSSESRREKSGLVPNWRVAGQYRNPDGSLGALQEQLSRHRRESRCIALQRIPRFRELLL